MKGTNVATMVGDGGVRPTILQGKLESKPRKRPNRVACARVGWEDVGEGRFMFTLTRKGLLVHRKCARKASDLLLPFDRLTGGAGHEFMDEAVPVRFCATAAGLEVRRVGSKQVRVLGWQTLANAAWEQPLLFADLAVGALEKA